MDEDQFRATTFDAKEYANAILANNNSTSQIPLLFAAIDRVQVQIKNLVATHHDQLLDQPTAVAQLRPPLNDLKSRLDELDSSLQKLQSKIQTPHQELDTHVRRLDKLSQASELLRRTSRFVMLARRLQAQMDQVESDPPPHQPQEEGKERTIAKAALTIAQLATLLDAPDNMSIRSVNVVAQHVSFIEEARATVSADMQQMVLAGLSNLDHTLLASSLQTAYNLRVLPVLVQSLLNDLSKAVDERIRAAFDISKISKDAAAREGTSSPHPQPSSAYKSRVRTEPTNLTAPQWTAILWTRLQSMIEEMSACCIKVYTLEKVLRLKADAVSNVVLMDEAMSVLENRPSAAFWTALSNSLKKHSRDSTRSYSQFLQQTLSTGYPKLLRLFHEFFTEIAIQTDAIYTQKQQSPETVLVLHGLTHLESAYLLRSTTKLTEQVAQLFSRSPRVPSTASEASNFARTIANELDTAKFDPLLLRSVAKGMVGGLEALVSRADAQIVHDRSAVTLTGPTATPQQITNAEITNCLYLVSSELQKLSAEHSEAVFGILNPALQAMKQKIDEVSKPLLTSIRRELDAIVNRIHRVDFAKPMDPMSDMGGGSGYMKDLVERLSYIKSEIFSRYSMGDLVKEWALAISKNVARSFVLHASIAKPLGESGKLQLTSDMTELEFSLSAFITDTSKNRRGSMLEAVGSDYRALRGMRQLLFLDNAQLASSQATAGVAPLVVLHHILVRSPLPLPHTLHGWQEAEYVRWIGEHTEDEGWSLIDNSLVHWEKTEDERDEGSEYLDLARSVLKNARGHAGSSDE